MGLIKKNLQLYAYNCRLRVFVSMQYKADFIISMFLTLLNAMLGPLVQYLIFTNTKGFPGWSLNQVMLFQGVVLVFLGIKNTLFGEVRTVAMQIAWKGDFDRFLLKPTSALLSIFANSFSLSGLVTIISGIIVIVWWSVILELSINVTKIVLIVLCLLFSILLCAALVTFLCGIVIMFVKIGRMWEFLDVILRFSNYPLNIYPQFMETVFFTVLPIGIMAYVPTNILLGKINSMMIISFFSSVFLLLISLKFWKFCIKKYSSAGG